MNYFCKVEDINKNLYILTDKNKQPLIADPRLRAVSNSGTCLIANRKKFLDNPVLIHGGKTLYGDAGASDIFAPDNDTKIQFTFLNHDAKDAIVNKSEIDFNIYDIATINKNIIITDDQYRQYSGKAIEEYYPKLFGLDRNNKNYIEKMGLYIVDFWKKGEDAPLNVISENIRKTYDYYQNFLIKEDITKLKSSENNNIYIKIGIGIFVFIIIALWIFKQ
jgi:hypothetical protein